MSDVVKLPAARVYRLRETFSGRLILQHIHPKRKRWSDVKGGNPNVEFFEIVPVGFSARYVEYTARIEMAEKNAARHRKARAEKAK